jgi:dihydroflavonol-4-reductase
VKVLVTGGNGFIGSRLAAALVARGDTVRVLHRANSRLVALEGLPVTHCIGDVLEADSVARAVAGCTLVFHVAAISSYWREGRELVYRVNVDGTRNVMDACLAAGVARVVHTSSVAAIGLPAEGTLGTEDMSFDAFSATWPYADSKRLAEQEVNRAVARGLSAVVVNPAVVIGAGDHNLISGSMIVALARHSLPAVPPGGICFADVDAIVEGHLRAAEIGRTGERYILGGENLTFHQTVAIIARVVGRQRPRWTLPARLLRPTAAAVDAYNRLSSRPPIVNGQQILLSGRHLYYDTSKALRELDYPLLPIAGAIEKAYCWYREHGYLS